MNVVITESIRLFTQRDEFTVHSSNSTVKQKSQEELYSCSWSCEPLQYVLFLKKNHYQPFNNRWVTKVGKQREEELADHNEWRSASRYPLGKTTRSQDCYGWGRPRRRPGAFGTSIYMHASARRSIETNTKKSARCWLLSSLSVKARADWWRCGTFCPLPAAISQSIWSIQYTISGERRLKRLKCASILLLHRPGFSFLFSRELNKKMWEWTGSLRLFSKQ